MKMRMCVNVLITEMTISNKKKERGLSELQMGTEIYGLLTVKYSLLSF